MSTKERLQPLSFGIAVILTALTGVFVLILAIGSVVSHSQALGWSVAIMMAIYGAIILSIAWAAYRRYAWAWGMLVATALLNAFSIASFLDTDDPFQFWIVLVWLVIVIVTGVAAILPSTRLAMHGRH